jgi:hypothetical protein
VQIAEDHGSIDFAFNTQIEDVPAPTAAPSAPQSPRFVVDGATSTDFETRVWDSDPKIGRYPPYRIYDRQEQFFVKASDALLEYGVRAVAQGVCDALNAMQIDTVVPTASQLIAASMQAARGLAYDPTASRPKEPTQDALMRAFTLGMMECMSDVTTHFDHPLIDTYDFGRTLGRTALRLDEERTNKVANPDMRVWPREEPTQDLPYVVTHARSGDARQQVLARFKTRKAAEGYLANGGEIDPDDLAEGYYGIDGPEETVSTPHVEDEPDDLTPQDLRAWADGVLGNLGTEYADRVSELEAELARQVMQTCQRHDMLRAASEPEDPLALLRELGEYKAGDFENDVPINGADLVDWFRDFRKRVWRTLHMQPSGATHEAMADTLAEALREVRENRWFGHLGSPTQQTVLDALAQYGSK